MWMCLFFVLFLFLLLFLSLVWFVCRGVGLWRVGCVACGVWGVGVCRGGCVGRLFFNIE